MRSGFIKAAAVLGVLLLAAACASQPAPAAAGAPGFFTGMLHGFIAPVTFIVSIFNDNVRMYAFPNAGVWYDFGWLLGFMFLGGAGAGGRAASR